jgi:16S rRNA (uracil1498-N3)-methyltransferase
VPEYGSPFGQPVTQVVVDSLAPERVRIEGDEARHLVSALRLKAGDAFVATDGQGGVARLKALALDRRGVDALVTERAHVPRREPRLWLVAEADGARADWIVEKAVELGAHAFVPLGEQAPGRVGRFRRVARAGLKQSLSAWELAFPEGPALDLARAAAPARTWIARPGGAPVLEQALPPQGDVFLVCGGPAGFARGELAAWEALPGAVPVDLGGSRLRAETAALALLLAASLGRERVQRGPGSGRETA